MPEAEPELPEPPPKLGLRRIVAATVEPLPLVIMQLCPLERLSTVNRRLVFGMVSVPVS